MCPAAQLVPHRLPHPATALPGRITTPKTEPERPGPHAAHAGGLPPLPRWSQAITGGSTEVEAPHYPPGDTSRCQQSGCAHPTPDVKHSNGCKFVLFHSR